MELSTDKIRAAADGPVGRIEINNPARRNAISLEMWEGIGAAIGAFAADPAIRCVVVTGAGDKAFASGADISQFAANRDNAEAAAAYARISVEGRRKLLAFEKPLVARIRGFCLGGGLGIALAADIRVASDDSTFGVPAARLSIAYDRINLKNLVALVGPARAKEILITARRYTAAEAAAMGLVNMCVPAGELDAAVADITGRIAENAPLSMRASKLTVNELTKDDAAFDEALVDGLTRACFDSRDYREGREAFMEKRKPVFEGR